VRDHFNQALTLHAKTPAVVLMIPLLFEASLESLCTEIWFVDCTAPQQLERLMNRDGMNRDAALARIDAQWPLSRKRGLADHVITNSGHPGSWEQQARALLQMSPATGL
jgi:dephospho-CoA kinase